MASTHKGILRLLLLALVFVLPFSDSFSQTVTVGTGTTPAPHCPGSSLRINRNTFASSWGDFVNDGFTIWWNDGTTKTNRTANVTSDGGGHVIFDIPSVGPFGSVWVVADISGGGWTNADSVQITFTANDPSTLSYGSGSNKLCTSITNASPAISPGWGSCVNCPITNLAITAGTGVIDAGGSTAGASYQVIALTNGSCPVNCTTDVDIEAPPDPSFTYSSTQFCKASSAPYTPAAPTTPGGSFNATPLFQLTLNTGNGMVTPSTSTANTFNISYTTPNLNSCGPQTQVQNNLITVTEDWDSSFTIPGSHVYCQADCSVIPVPTIPSHINDYDYEIVSGGPGLTFFKGTPRIIFASSDPGVYDVFTETNGPCIERDTIRITITASTSAIFDYVADSLCGNSPTPEPATGAYTAGGSFTFTLISGPIGSNLGLRPNGEIVPDSSDPGTYQVTYEVGTGACFETATDNIIITQDRDSSFLPSSFTFCENDFPININPNTPGDWADWGILPATAGFDSLNLTANFNPSVAGPGVFNITLTTVGGVCAETHTEAITVNALDAPYFNYNDTSFCVYDPPIVPDSITEPINANEFLYNLVSGTGPLELDTLTGTIDPSLSGPGVYQIFHTSQGNCPQFDDDTVRIWRQEQPDFSFTRVYYCVNEGVTPPDIAPLDGGGIFSDSVITGGSVYLDLDASTGDIRPDTSEAGIYMIRYTTTGPCPEVATDTVRIRLMDSAYFDYPAANYCQGLDTIDTVTMPNPGGYTPQFSNLSPGNLSLNTNNGHVNLLTSDADSTFIVELTWTDAFCNVPLRDTITIDKPDSGSVTYNPVGICEDTVAVTGPTPTMFGPPGGYFFMEPIPDTDPRAIVVDSMSGEVTPVGGDTGRYNIFYVPPGSCVEADSNEVRFDTLPDPSFSYPSNVFCISDTAVLPTTVDTTGTYSALPPTGLSLNPFTGEIIPGTSTAGVYVVKYRVNSACPMADSLPITIIDPGSAAFSYQDTTFCTGSINPLPNLQGAVPGGTFTSVPAGLDFVDDPDTSLSGQIDLSTTPSNPYTVFYTTPGCAVTDSFNLNVLPGDSAQFTYDLYEYCVTGLDTAVITMLATPGGSFAELSGTLLPDPSNGSIPLNPSLAGGPYVVTHTTGGSCPTTDTAHVLVSGPAPADFYYPQGNVYCTNDSNPVPIITGTGGGYFTHSFGLWFTDSTSSSTGEINMQLTPPGSYTITYQPNVACSEIETFNITVLDTPTTGFNYTPDSVCQGSGTIAPSFPATLSGTFTELTGFLDVDSATGVINTNTSVPGGPYRVYYAPNIACAISGFDDIVIVERDSALFAYPTTTWCTTFPPQIPAITGTGGGIFSQRDASGNDTLNMNTLTGEINPGMSGLDFFWVKYTTQGACPAADSVQVGNFRATAAEAHWSSVILCTEDSIASADSATPLNGAWTVDPVLPNFWSDSVNGIINLRTAPPGTYQITYTSTAISVCPSADVDTLQITKSDTATIYYRDSVPGAHPHFCPNALNDPVPQISGTSGGIFSSVSTGIKFKEGSNFNSLTGIIDVSECQPQTNFYIIDYETGGDCGTTAWDTVFIDEIATANIDYGESNYCQTDTNPRPSLGGATGGFFYDVGNTGRLVFIDDSTGQIDLANSVPQRYEIGYQAGLGCSDANTDIVVILDNPAPDLIYGIGVDIDSVDIELCYGIPMEFQATGGILGTDFFTFLVGDSIVRPSQFTGLADKWTADSLDPGNNPVIVLLESAESGCPAYDTVNVRVFETPVGEIRDMPNTVSSGETVFFNIAALTDNTWFTWTMRGTGDVVPDNIGGETSVMGTGGTEPISRPTPELGDPLTPARLTYTFTPFANDCVGENLIGSVEVKPDDFDFFIPGVITPNGNGKNDYWEIKWGGEFQPEEFSIDVYNRSGGLEYTLERLDEEWYAPLLADGTYWYILRRLSDEAVIQKGGVRIKRD